VSRLTYADGHFPFCIDAGEMWDGTTYFDNKPSNASDKQTKVVGPGTLYPVGMTLEEVAEIYWRMKYIKASCSYEVDVYTSEDEGEWGTPHQSFEVEVNKEDYEGELIDDDGRVCNFIEIYYDGIYWEGDKETARNVTTLVGQETSLVCLNQWVLDAHVGTLYDHNWPDGIPWPSQLFLEWKPRSCLFYDGKYFPYFRVSSISANYLDTTELNSYAQKIDQGAGHETLRAFPGSSLFGKELTVFGPPAPTLSPPHGAIDYLETTAANVSIEAHKYFTYGGIYDEDTGARL